MTAGQSAAGRDVESINEEAVEAAAGAIEVALRPYPVTRNAFDARLGWGASVEELASAALAAALPLLRLSDVPGLERQLRDKIAGEIEALRSALFPMGRSWNVAEFDLLTRIAAIARGSDVSS